MTPALKNMIFTALDAAVDERGCTDLLFERPERIAFDLAAGDANIGASKDWFHLHELVPVVRDWLSHRREKVLEP
jgi:hypothetical protein